jgi:hypothetical protein
MVVEPRKLTLRCPECEAHLVVDSITGEVLFHKSAKKAPAGGQDFDSLLEEMKAERLQAESVFEREVAALKDRDRLMSEKFEEALRRAKEEGDEKPPPRPFDFD